MLQIAKHRVTAEKELKLKQYGKYIAFLRRHPTHATRALFRIIIPPHESSMLETAWMGYKDNIYQCSRGTSKTFTIGSLFSPLRSLLFRNVRILVASASMFRGGKMILKDSERLVMNQLADQKPGPRWARASITHPKPLKRDPDLWSMEFSSHSFTFTVPTNNEEAVRGTRAHIIVFDERNTFDNEAIQKVYVPFAIVGQKFADPALGAEGNQTFSIGTIDYTYREWYKEIENAKDLARLQYLAFRAMKEGDWDTFDALKDKHGDKILNLSMSYQRYDYTDLLIPTKIGKYKLNYPGARPVRDIKDDSREKCQLIYTYPVDKEQIESKLDQGMIDKESWEAEHRNMFIHATGSVYPPALLEKVTGALFSEAEEKRNGWDHQERGERYLPPILFECSDPCVLGIDVARTAAYTAFVIIRAGYAPRNLASNKHKTYCLTEHVGPTSWSNVIWAEQHQHMTTKQTAEKIHEFRQRYNIVSLVDIAGIYMDARGGGAHVRDELANPTHPTDPETGRPIPGWQEPQKIYDPEDKEYQHLVALDKTWGGLKLLMTTDIMNQELVSFSRAQMEVAKLYIAPYRSVGDLPAMDRTKYLPGYLGVRVLKHQMLRIQAETTPSGKSVRYVMPGGDSKIENQKDMLMAFLYACYGLRLVYNLAVAEVNKPPPEAYGMVVNLTGRLIR